MVTMIVLNLVTCGVYWFYWCYVTTQELKVSTGRADLNPGMDLLLNIVTCSMYGIFVEYRNAQAVHQVFAQRGIPHEDKSNMILIMNVLMFFTGGVTAIIAVVFMQEELNKLAALEAGQLPY